MLCDVGWASVDNLQRQKEEVWNSVSEDVKKQYGREYLDRQYESYMKIMGTCSSDVSVVVRAMCSALLSKRPMERYPVGRGAATLISLSLLLPTRLMDKVVGLIAISKDILPAALRH